MPRKRKNIISSEQQQQDEEIKDNQQQNQQNLNDQETPQQGTSTQQAQQVQNIQGRREQYQEIARRRAAHFATFEAQDELFEDNIHVGGNEAKNLGPWSSAQELVNQRDVESKKRQERLKQQEIDKVKMMAQRITWKPEKKQKQTISNRVPSLQEILANKVAELIEYVESFEGFPDSIKIKVASQCCQKNTLSYQAALMFVQDNPKDVVFNKCTELDQEELLQVLETAVTSQLDRLELGYCGRGLKDLVLEKLSMHLDSQNINSLPNMTKLKLFGAYKMGDNALKRFLQFFPNLLDLNIGQGSRLYGDFLETIKQYNPNLETLNLYQCRGISGQQVAEFASQLRNLKSLDLTGVGDVNDEAISMVVSNCPQIIELRIGQANSRGDACVQEIAKQCSKLRTLSLDDLPKLTDVGIKALVDANLKLQNLSLFNCTRITEESLVALLGNCKLYKLNISRLNIGDPTIIALQQHKETFQSLNISFCRKISDEGLGFITDKCHGLQQIQVFGCSQLTDKYFKGHRNEHVKIEGAYTEGNQIIAH